MILPVPGIVNQEANSNDLFSRESNSSTSGQLVSCMVLRQLFERGPGTSTMDTNSLYHR
jgi:hypothetical protein